ncbi:MAG: hypothetical protein V7776_10940 [Halopseudomonas aestusnigri]
MKGKSKIIVSAMGGLLALVVATSLVFFYMEINKRDNASKSLADYNLSVGEEVRPGYLGRVDHLLDLMEFEKITILVPGRVNIDDDVPVKVSLRLANSIEVLRLSIINEALKVGAKVKVSDKMAVLLSGDSFQISPRGPAEQEVSRFQQTDWKWDIQPRETGSHEIHLTVIVIFEVDGKLTSRAIRSFDKIIKVTGSATN